MFHLVRMLLLVFIIFASTLCFSEEYRDPQHPGVVQIKILKDGNRAYFGTGFFIRPNIVVTNFHVVAQLEGSVSDLMFFSESTSSDKHFAKIIYLDAKNELAVLSTGDYRHDSFYSIDSSLSKKENDLPHTLDVHSPGFLNTNFYILDGKMNKNTVHDSRPTITAVNHIGLKSGSSGSPILYNNKVIGILSSTDQNTTIFFTPADRLENLLAQSFLSCVEKSCIEAERTELKHQAGKGDFTSMVRLALFYASGDAGFDQNPQISINLYRKALPQDKLLMLDLGIVLVHLGKNYNDALTGIPYIFQAAMNNNMNAQFQLGKVYLHGSQNGKIEKDYEKAVQWLIVASNNGHAYAQFELGVMYGSGQGVPTDYEKAREFYEQSSALGNSKASYNLADMYYHGKGIEKDITKAIHYLEKASEQGSFIASLRLGNIYLQGFEVDRDFEEAAKWIETSIQQNPNYRRSHILLNRVRSVQAYN